MRVYDDAAEIARLLEPLKGGTGFTGRSPGGKSPWTGKSPAMQPVDAGKSSGCQQEDCHPNSSTRQGQETNTRRVPPFSRPIVQQLRLVGLARSTALTVLSLAPLCVPTKSPPAPKRSLYDAATVRLHSAAENLRMDVSGRNCFGYQNSACWLDWDEQWSSSYFCSEGL